MSSYYYSVRQKRNCSTDNWAVVSLYDSENHFQGPAIFEDKESAQNRYNFESV